eukprot:TRINITY_DN7798_c0_g1_i3.p1 TRINITY_DN7798_c0_g1~~TRINITY_DN7798_c0_g1_i3.p1  ORF type:complete len:183 (+),score=36.35 TRINITY_DN7798_c0_g1_i3:54-602(+)
MGGKIRTSTNTEDILDRPIAKSILSQKTINFLRKSSNDYPLQFSKPSELYEVFLNLEEQNTNMITRMQELDQEIERKREQFNAMKGVKEKEIDKLYLRKEQLEKAIKEQKDYLQIIGHFDSNDEKNMEDHWLNKIAKILSSFSMFKHSKSAIEGADTLLVLGKVEHKLEEMNIERKKILQRE